MIALAKIRNQAVYIKPFIRDDVGLYLFTLFLHNPVLTELVKYKGISAMHFVVDCSMLKPKTAE